MLTKYQLYNVSEKIDEILTEFSIDKNNCGEFRLVNKETGEIKNIDELKMLLQMQTDFLQQLIAFYKNLEIFNNNLDNEITLLKQKKEKNTEKNEKIKHLIDEILKGKKYNDGVHQVSYRKSTSVNIANIDLLDDEFKRVKTEVVADKIKIKEFLKNGNSLKGAFLVENKNILIK